MLDGPVDILAGVMAAADPAAASRKTAQLQSLGGADGSADFGSQLAGAVGPARTPHVPRAAEALSPEKEFEALFVQQMVSELFSGTDEVFGGGFSGDMWKSMMSRTLARELVGRQDFGVADLIKTSLVRVSEDEVAGLAGVNDLSGEGADAQQAGFAARERDTMVREFLQDLLNLPEATQRG